VAVRLRQAGPTALGHDPTPGVWWLVARHAVCVRRGGKSRHRHRSTWSDDPLPV
jgi:hypothetical protein